MDRVTAKALTVFSAVLFVLTVVNCGRDTSVAADGSDLRLKRTMVLSGLNNP